MLAENMSFNPVVKTRLMARLCLCVSVLALSSCGTVNGDRYAFWNSHNNKDTAPDLRDMPHNTNGDNQARDKLNGLQQELMADHAAAIEALQNQGAPTISVLSSAQDIAPVTQNKVLQQPLMPPPLPVKLPQQKATIAQPPTLQPIQPVVTTPSKPSLKWSGVSVLPQSMNTAVTSPAKTPVKPAPVMQAPPVVTFVAPKNLPVSVPAVAMPAAMPQPMPQAQPVLPPPTFVAEQPLPPPPMPAPALTPTAPMLAPAAVPPVYQPKPLRTYTMPASGIPPQNLPPVVAPVYEQTAMVAPAPIAQAIADNSSVDINMDALDNFGGPTPLAPRSMPRPQRMAPPPIRPEVAAAQQPYAYGYSNYSIKREMFENNQGNPIPANDSVLINPIWEAAPTPGDFGHPLDSNPLSSFDSPATGGLLSSVPFANNASKLGPQGLKAVERIAAQWQRNPQNLVLSSFAAGLRSASANQALANARSNAVKQRLVALGVPANQIRLVANGNNQNKTPHVDVFVDSE